MIISTFKILVLISCAFLLFGCVSSKPTVSSSNPSATRNDSQTSKVQQSTIESDLSSEEDQKALRKVKEKAQKDHPDDFSTQKYVYENQVVAYRFMETVAPSSLKSKIERDHPYDFSTQKYVYENQIEAQEYMNSVPDSKLKAKVQKDHPNDFSTQKYVYDNQMDAKEAMEDK